MRNRICRSIIFSLVTALTTHAELKPDDFVNPPVDAKPMTWMHMMNSNGSKEGLTKDLQALSDAGIGGALIFSVAKPEIANGAQRFNSPEFRDLLVHGVKEADRLGLTIGLHNCDGWSSSGGPWVKPEDAMKKLVWSEAVVRGGSIAVELPPHANRLGFYRDVAVVAYPVSESEWADFNNRFSWSGSAPQSEFSNLKDDDLDTMVVLRAAKGKKAHLQWNYEKPFCARSIYIEHSTAPGAATLFASDDGKVFEKVAELSEFRPSKTKRAFIGSFPAVTAKYFKVEFQRPMPVVAAQLNSFAQFPDWLVHSCMAKGTADFSGVTHPDGVPNVKRSEVKVFEASALSGNRITPRLPVGVWRVMRFGYTLTGEHNHPATAAGKGLECDKLDKVALDKHFAAYVGKVAKEAGQLTGRAFQTSEIDSYEMGWQNWTDAFETLFSERKGYDLQPYLPLIAGRFVGDLETADAVLADFKDVVASLMTENYFMRFTELCNQHGLKSYIEPYGNGPLNELTIGGNCDIPMGEFWMHHDRGTQIDAPIHAAHTYGKRVISAESFTQRQALNWKVHPWLMKPSGDTAWAKGINEFMFHRYVHQPNTHVAPGMTMGSVGSHIDGTQTWWLNAGKAWMNYNQRGQFLLRQGHPVADLLVYAGDRAPQTAISNAAAGLPSGYNMDSCDAFVLHERVKVQDGRMVLPEGTAYSVLLLAKCDRMNLKTLQRVTELVEAGVTVVGTKPKGPLSLMERKKHASEFAALADRLWGDGTQPRPVGKGGIIPEKKWPAEGLQGTIEPDLKIAELETFRFVHRKVGSDDLYFIHNPKGEATVLNCSFRVADRIPEFWDADTGRMERAAQFRNVDGRTECPIRLDPFGSVFVVFRSASEGIDPVATVIPETGRVILDANDQIQLIAEENGTYEIKLDSGKTVSVNVADLQAPQSISGPWKVEFDGLGLKGDKVVEFKKLTDWKDHARDDLKYFSGTAAYRTTLNVPTGWLGEGKRVYLDLGRVEIAAEVVLNGAAVGTLWKPPFVIDVTDQVVEGNNKLEVCVTNLWANRLIGDEALKDTSGYSKNKPMPDWFVNNEPMPEGPRSTFTTYNFYTNNRKLMPTGLLGPVELKQETVQTITQF
ncbi:glycosyl hydrolase [Pontiellaceae bacterium B12227]|nr:glycosyl hydrolase [Pontiellaceae bacterium B12227]